MRLFRILLLIAFTYQFHAHAGKNDINAVYDIGNAQLYLNCTPNEGDQPLLVLEQGFGRFGSDGAWQANIEALADHFQVCFYDRTGLGKSSENNQAISVFELAQQLRQLLNKAGLESPHYMAGGSYAAYIIRAYNHLYPQQILGAVLIDPPPFGYFKTMATRWPGGFKTDNLQLQRFYEFEQSVRDPLFARAPEKIDHMQSEKQIEDTSGFGDKPIVTIFSAQLAELKTAYDPPFVPDNIASVMNQLYAGVEQQYQSLSSNSEILHSKSDKHHLHLSDPELVLKAIKSLPQKSNHPR